MTVPKQCDIILKVDRMQKYAFVEGMYSSNITQERTAILTFGFEYFVQQNISNLLDKPVRKNLLF